MADKLISSLTATTTLAAADMLVAEISASGNSRKITKSNLGATLQTYSTAWALAGTGQTAVGVYDFAVDGAKANIDFIGLAAFNELLVFARLLTDGTSGQRAVYASVDNGSTFYSGAGDYKTISTNGVETSNQSWAFHETASTAARSFVTHIVNLKGVDKLATLNVTTGIFSIFTASSSDVNAIRINNFQGGNITGGTVRVYAR